MAFFSFIFDRDIFCVSLLPLLECILREKMGLIVSKPKPGGSGNSNDGNTARKAFENPELLAKCLGLNCQLIKNFKTILIAMSLQLPLNAENFDNLCSETARIYVKNYAWFPMSATVHKILMHGKDIITTSILPLGMLGEEASEARNKHFKNYRMHHSRKINREATLSDVFYRLMDTSDIKISSLNLESRRKYKKMSPIPIKVRHLLSAPEVKVTNAYSFMNDTQNDSSDADETDVNRDIETSEFIRGCAFLDELELSSEEYD